MKKTDSPVPSVKILSRRAALRRAVVTGLGLSGLSAVANDAEVHPSAAEPEFVPENDYPYFGYEPRPE